MDFSYEVTLSPDNNRKWQEMLESKESKEIMLKMYELMINNDRIYSNRIIESFYESYKENRLQEHYNIFQSEEA
tara:strand:- start:512 stop:733 length:222 start_codon:yes stop_codon:yes gene_type:complete